MNFFGTDFFDDLLVKAKDLAPFAPNEVDIDAADYLMALMTRLGYSDA